MKHERARVMRLRKHFKTQLEHATQESRYDSTIATAHFGDYCDLLDAPIADYMQLHAEKRKHVLTAKEQQQINTSKRKVLRHAISVASAKMRQIDTETARTLEAELAALEKFIL